jgi:hypothetical protein
MMPEANEAYQQGDEARLRRLLEEYESRPESVVGVGTAADLVRVIRKIDQVRRRLRAIEAEINEVTGSELHSLRAKVDAAAPEGTDLLALMSTNLVKEIAKAREELRSLGVLV